MAVPFKKYGSNSKKPSPKFKRKNKLTFESLTVTNGCDRHILDTLSAWYILDKILLLGAKILVSTFN
jgi:hypothetical protein